MAENTTAALTPFTSLEQVAELGVPVVDARVNPRHTVFDPSQFQQAQIPTGIDAAGNFVIEGTHKALEPGEDCQYIEWPADSPLPNFDFVTPRAVYVKAPKGGPAFGPEGSYATIRNGALEMDAFVRGELDLTHGQVVPDRRRDGSVVEREVRIERDAPLRLRVPNDNALLFQLMECKGNGSMLEIRGHSPAAYNRFGCAFYVSDPLVGEYYKRVKVVKSELARRIMDALPADMYAYAWLHMRHAQSRDLATGGVSENDMRLEMNRHLAEDGGGRLVQVFLESGGGHDQCLAMLARAFKHVALASEGYVQPATAFSPRRQLAATEAGLAEKIRMDETLLRQVLESQIPGSGAKAGDYLDWLRDGLAPLRAELQLAKGMGMPAAMRDTALGKELTGPSLQRHADSIEELRRQIEGLRARLDRAMAEAPSRPAPAGYHLNFEGVDYVVHDTDKPDYPRVMTTAEGVEVRSLSPIRDRGLYESVRALYRRLHTETNENL